MRPECFRIEVSSADRPFLPLRRKRETLQGAVKVGVNGLEVAFESATAAETDGDINAQQTRPE